MSTQLEVTKTRIQRCVDQRETVDKLHENLLAQVEARDEREPTDTEKHTLAGYRTQMVTLDEEIAELNGILEQQETSAQMNRKVRAHLAGRNADGELNPAGEFQYRTFGSYARDVMIARYDQIAELAGGKVARDAAKDRLSRAPQHTLSSDVDGLQPEQHFAQILEVIDASRPIVESSRRLALERGAFTFPHVDQKPEVLLQATEKTEGGTANMQVSMATVTAKTFIGGGNLSWQAVNWSTPDALNLWFTMAGEQYAKKTEGTAAAILTSCGTANRLGTAGGRLPTGGTATFQDWLEAIVAGVQTVETNSDAIANTLYLSSDMFYAAAALVSDSGAMLIQQGALSLATGGGNIAGLRVVKSKGLGSGIAIIGDSGAFLVAETPGAPVQLRVTEPSIGGFEVGVIGAFAAECYDDNRFAQIT